MKVDPESVFWVAQVTLFFAVGWFIICWLNAMFWFSLGNNDPFMVVAKKGFNEPITQLQDLKEYVFDESDDGERVVVLPAVTDCPITDGERAQVDSERTGSCTGPGVQLDRQFEALDQSGDEEAVERMPRLLP